MKSVSPVQSQIAAPSLTSKSGISDTSIGLCIVLLPIVLVLSVLVYKKHKAVRRQQQIEILERIWKLNHREKAT